MKVAIRLGVILVSLCSYAVLAQQENYNRTISFSGYDWRVKSSVGKIDPGPNNYSDSTRSVWVDRPGKLHLRLRRDKTQWLCPEVASLRSFGYGTYRFYIEAPIDLFNPNVVLGLFTWSDDPAYDHREIDVEFAKWGGTNTQNAQYVVQPFFAPDHLWRFSTGRCGCKKSVHSFTWKPDSVAFESHHGDKAKPVNAGAKMQEHTFTSGIPQAGGENVRINLWLYGGNPPNDRRDIEIVVTKFEFLPAQ